jgi:hypothetical protein
MPEQHDEPQLVVRGAQQREAVIKRWADLAQHEAMSRRMREMWALAKAASEQLKKRKAKRRR